jgi:hypothetical protein
MYAIITNLLFIVFAVGLLIALFIYARRKTQPTIKEVAPPTPEVVPRAVGQEESPVEKTQIAATHTSQLEIPDMELCPDRNARKQEPYWSAPENEHETISEELSRQATQTLERRMSDRAQIRKCLSTPLEPPVLPSQATKFYFFNYPYDETCKMKNAPKEVLMAGENAVWSDVMHLSNGDINKLASELADDD